MNVVITGLGADYTGLGSFGTADNFGENLVSQKESFLWVWKGEREVLHMSVPLIHLT